MNREELKVELDKLGIPENYYSLYGDLWTDSTMVIYQNYSKWEVFHWERGSRYDEHIFFSEHAACEYLLDNFINLRRWADENDIQL